MEGPALWRPAAVVLGLLLSVVFVMILAGLVGPVSNPAQWLVAIPTVAGCLLIAGWMWSEKLGVRSLFRRNAGDTHGSARLASPKEIARLVRAGDAALLIGRDPKTGIYSRLLGYDGPAHLLTLAPTRAGKGVGTVIPNLLLSARSMLVVDPKGENVRVAGRLRADYGPTHVLDPFGVTGTPGAAYNPLERMPPRQPRPRRGGQHPHRPEPGPLGLSLRRPGARTDHGVPGAAAEPDGRLQPLALPAGLRGAAGHRPRCRGRKPPAQRRCGPPTARERPGSRWSARVIRGTP